MQPNTLGITRLRDLNLREAVPFINWTFFFRAWRMSGKYDGIDILCDCRACRTSWLRHFPEEERPKAEEALKLFRDAQEMLRRFLDEHLLQINAAIGLFPVRTTDGNTIIVLHEGQEIRIPMLRQQQTSSDGFCYSLADFLHPKGDFIGVFACTVQGLEELIRLFDDGNDIYYTMLAKTLADRLAEAASEWLHFQVRKKYWGYNPDEELDLKAIQKNQYPGIRPAVGYPSLPDQSIIFELDKLINLHEIGITLSENGAMSPNASVCGLYFSNPKSKYFTIEQVDRNQLADYAARRGKSTEEMKKWLGMLIND